MAEPTIIRGSDHFFTTTYEGNGGGQRVGNFVPFTDNGTIAKSCIFNHGDTTNELQLAAPGSAGNQKTFTISCWFKRSKIGDQQYMYAIWDGTDDGSPYVEDRHYAQFETDNTLEINFWDKYIRTNKTFEDTSKWYHYLLAVDSTQSTASDRIKLYIDGDLITDLYGSSYFAQDSNLAFAKRAFTIGNTKAGDNAQEPFEGYLAEFNAIEGSALTPSTFGLTDTSTGRWIPKTLTGITYGTNGFRLQFANTAGQTIGHDSSGSGNTFTVDGIVAADITTDSPTQNHTILNSIDIGSNITLTEGGLKATYSGGAQSYGVASRTPVKGGKYYCECTVNTRGSQLMFVNVWNETEFLANHGNDNPVFKNGGIGYRDDTGDIDCTVRGGINIDYGATYTDNDVIGIALDADTGTVWYSKNGTWQNNASSAQIANGLTANSAVTGLISASPTYNENNRFLFGVTAHSGHVSTWNFGQKAFSYTPPTGYNAVQQDNFPETSKDLPDFVWSKSRDNTESHTIYDSSRGATKQISSNNTTAENTQDDGLQKFLKGGYQCEDHSRINQSGISYASWKWHANGGTTSANTDGSGATVASTIQANQTAGFSIVTFTTSNNSGFNTDKVAHGLSQAPEWFMFKRLDDTSSWIVYHKDAYLSNQHALVLNSSAAVATFNTELNPSMFSAAPTSSVFSYVSGSAVAKGSNQVAYCWHGIEGYSKFGVYTGTGNADGRYVYTGFKPAWLMIKARSTSNSWKIIDNTRFKFNPINNILNADQNSAESNQSINIDFLSNGFKVRTSGTYINETNQNGNPYVYMAFAEHPFVGNGTNPVTAR